MFIGKKLYFDTSIDGRFWTGSPVATVGEIFVGPLGFLDELEVCLGLSAAWPTVTERVNALVEKLRVLPEEKRGFWKESFATDPIGVARELIRWRDELVMSGWEGETGEPRLQALAAATASVLPGIADRIQNIRGLLDNRATPKPAIDEVLIVQPQADLPTLWREVLRSLQDRGVPVSRWTYEVVEAAGNLEAVKGELSTPAANDESLLFLQPQTTWEAAEHVAAWLGETRDPARETVVIGATPELDSALSRYGLPTSGIEDRGPAAEEICNLLWFTVALAEKIPDTTRVLEFLLLKDKPLPRGLSRRLAKALHEYPGVGNRMWRQAAEEGLEALKETDPEWAKRAAGTLDDLFPADFTKGEDLPKDKIVARFEKVLRPWLNRKTRGDDLMPERFAAFCGSVRMLVDLLNSYEAEAIQRPQLNKLLADVADRSVRSLYPAQAGLRFIAGPEAMLGPADIVVWWNFSADTVPSIVPLPLSEAEYAELENEGCSPRQHWEQSTSAQSIRWWRPLELCRKQLVLVTPAQTVKGETNAPHPLYSELEARLSPDATLPVRTDGIETGLKNRVVTPAPRQPRRNWDLSQGVAPRDKLESPSGIQNMLQCPFKWVMNYHPKLHEPMARALPEGALLDGKLFHEIFHRLCEEMPAGPAAASEKADALFDELGAGLAAHMFLPGAEHERQKFRRKLVRSVERVTAFIQETGATLSASEETLTGTLAARPMEGQVDLILSSPDMIIDFKNSNRNRDKDLSRGVAVQLIAYARLLKESKGIDAAVAYFILNSQNLLRDTGGINGASGWEDLEQSYASCLAELQKTVTAAGIPGATSEVVTKNDKIEDGTIVLEPECKYCRFDILCGHNEISGGESS